MASAVDEQPTYGRRCGMGCQTWPDDDAYRVCPQCGEPTRRYRGVDPLTPAEAASLVKHIDFESFYDEWCARNGMPHD